MKTKKTPMRRCIGCMESKPKRQLIRIVSSSDGSLNIDLTGKANGRGVYLCPDRECMTNARKKKAIARNLEIEISEQDLDKLFEELAQYERKDS